MYSQRHITPATSYNIDDHSTPASIASSWSTSSSLRQRRHHAVCHSTHPAATKPSRKHAAGVHAIADDSSSDNILILQNDDDYEAIVQLLHIASLLPQCVLDAMSTSSPAIDVAISLGPTESLDALVNKLQTCCDPSERLECMIQCWTKYQSQPEWNAASLDRWKELDKLLGKNMLDAVDNDVVSRARELAIASQRDPKNEPTELLGRLAALHDTEWKLRPYELLRDLHEDALKDSFMKDLRRIACTIKDAAGATVPWVVTVIALHNAAATRLRKAKHRATRERFRAPDTDDAIKALIEGEDAQFHVVAHKKRKRAPAVTLGDGSKPRDHATEQGEHDLGENAMKQNKRKDLLGESELIADDLREGGDDERNGDTYAGAVHQIGLWTTPPRPETRRAMIFPPSGTPVDRETAMRTATADIIDLSLRTEVTDTHDLDVSGIASQPDDAPVHVNDDHGDEQMGLPNSDDTEVTEALVEVGWQGYASLATGNNASSHILFDTDQRSVSTAPRDNLPPASSVSGEKDIFKTSPCLARKHALTMEAANMDTPDHTAMKDTMLEQWELEPALPFHDAPVPKPSAFVTGQRPATRSGRLAVEVVTRQEISSLLTTHTAKCQVLLTTDTAGALQSLQPGNWLSSTALCSILRLSNPDVTQHLILDSSCLDVSDAADVHRRAEHLQQRKSQSVFYMLINTGNCHWALCLLERINAKMEMYDPLPYSTTRSLHA
ncbi:hypothetical protein CB0940_07951 [Cercospora beticola]|uniref:Ubiquitin-like protease family profile domain-containing protein n=2 Tax=Cercospora beticola TaxID=122368 RepID=A0A2G5HA33_CERBT|nr:hypothetical protein CB0940_07951 [Cercospora beticola]PIA89394.1 hypothetical protein CB0940_07951 [Cercospora beticola]